MFKQRSVPYLNKDLEDDWEYLFFMQHTRMATRLLDWTENPYTALYFALSGAISHRFFANYTKETAAVWVLDPVAWNRRALDHLSFQKGILSKQTNELHDYSPCADISVMCSDPVAIIGTHNSPRIVAQRGVFTIFGKSCTPMEDLYAQFNFPQDCLMKLLLPIRRIDDLMKSLTAIGFYDSDVFPDVEGVSREINRHFGFRV